MGLLSSVNVCVRLQRYCCCKALVTMFAVVRTFTYNEENNLWMAANRECLPSFCFDTEVGNPCTVVQ